MHFIIANNHILVYNHIAHFAMDIENTERLKQVSKLTHMEVELISTKFNKKYQNLPYLTEVVVSLCLASFYFGFSLTFLSNISSITMVQYFGSSAGKASVVGGLIGALPLGAAFGALTAPLSMRCLTRKHFLLLFNGLAILISGIIQINSIGVLFACKLVQGFIVGNFMAITPIYINQLVPVEIQGSFGAFTQLFVVIAVVLCYFIGVIFTVNKVDTEFMWRFLFSFTGITCTIQSLLLIFNFIPESPVSLIETGKIQEAREVIAKFNTADIVDKVLNDTIAKVTANKSLNGSRLDDTHQDSLNSSNSPDRLTKQRNTRKEQEIPISKKAVFLGFQLPFMQQLSGINMIVTEIGSIVQTYDDRMALYAPLISNFIQLIATAFSVLALAHFGRRTLLLIGNFSLAIIDIIIGILFLILALNNWTPSVYIALGFIMLFMVSYGVTIGPVVWLYVPQIIPANLVPPATFMNWFGCSICVIATPFIIQAVGSPYPVFFIFGGVSLIFFIFNYFLVIQTKGLTLLQIARKMSF